MGNRVCRLGRRPEVEDRLTRPRRLARRPSEVDYGRLRRLILAGRLAPCFDALDDGEGLEDCPICFLYYPSLNRSVCCGKGICTECFVQMKSFNSTRTVRCPFCKTSSYAVEYRGARTEEEIGLEQAEEQKVIEAKIKMCLESQNADHAITLDQTCSASEAQLLSEDFAGQSSGINGGRDAEDWRESPISESIKSYPPSVSNTCFRRHEEFDLSLEEILLMEAIWESLQTSGSHGMVGPDSRICEEYNFGTYSSTFCQGGFSSSNFLGDEAPITNGRVTRQNMSQQKLSDSSCWRSRTSLELHRDVIEESNATSSGAEFSAESYSMFGSSWNQGVEIGFNMDEVLESNPSADGSYSSISIPSSSRMSQECALLTG